MRVIPLKINLIWPLMIYMSDNTGKAFISKFDQNIVKMFFSFGDEFFNEICLYVMHFLHHFIVEFSSFLYHGRYFKKSFCFAVSMSSYSLWALFILAEESWGLAVGLVADESEGVVVVAVHQIVFRSIFVYIRTSFGSSVTIVSIFSVHMVGVGLARPHLFIKISIFKKFSTFYVILNSTNLQIRWKLIRKWVFININL